VNSGGEKKILAREGAATSIAKTVKLILPWGTVSKDALGQEVGY